MYQFEPYLTRKTRSSSDWSKQLSMGLKDGILVGGNYLETKYRSVTRSVAPERVSVTGVTLTCSDTLTLLYSSPWTSLTSSTSSTPSEHTNNV